MNFVLLAIGILGVLESVKAAADVHCPVGGTIVEVNSTLLESPELVNKDPYKSGDLNVSLTCSVKDFNSYATPSPSPSPSPKCDRHNVFIVVFSCFLQVGWQN